MNDIKAVSAPLCMPQMEDVPCNICGTRTTKILYEQPDLLFNRDHFFNVVQCQSCSLAYVNPRPTQSAIDYYYPKEFYAEFDAAPDEQKKRYEREAVFVSQHAPKISGRKPKILDVGCANGDFPRLMRSKGWDIEGVEIGSSAKKISDFPVYNMLLPEIPRNEAYYDAITAWAVLEHVHDPMLYFRKAAALLNPGGVFIFLVTNVDSISSTKLFCEDIPRHTYFYNRKTIGAYLNQNGFELVQALDHDDVYGMPPAGWLVYYVHKILHGRDIGWNEFPPTRQQWLKKNNLSHSHLNTLRYASRHPISAIGSLALPLFAAWQKATKTYGITTYVARKPSP